MEVKEPIKSNTKSVWLISDTHFGHKNIIDFCGRPFSNVEEMNRILWLNWNNTVSNSDTIYHLGDVALSRERDPSNRSKPYITEKWINLLNGNKIFIHGDHDPENFGEKSKIIEYKNFKFLLIHNPKEAKFNGWIIHGHTHNNDLVNYPFINFNNRTINVSADVINYKPVNFDTIIELIRKPRESNINTISDI